MPQRYINFLHSYNADFSIYFRFGNGCEVVGHDDGVAQQAGPLAFRFGLTNWKAAWMFGTKHPAGYHGDNYLWQSGLKIVRLNDNRRSQLCCD